MAIKQKTVVTYKTTATAVSHSRTDIPIRDLVAVVDEPQERGGTNMGPSPTETALTALIACTNVIGHKNKREASLRKLGSILQHLQKGFCVTFQAVSQKEARLAGVCDQHLRLRHLDIAC